MMPGSDNLPEDIMIEILLRLPVKSLNRFICIHKSWHNIIKSNTFIHKHLCHNNPNNKEHILIQHCDPFNEGCVFNFLSDDLVRNVNRDFFHKVPYYTFVSGPCNGIFCLYSFMSEAGLLWNPANREIRSLPTLRYYHVPPNVQSYWTSLQLGWDQRMNDYKVVVFTEKLKRGDSLLEVPIDQHVAVYSLNNDSWGHFEDNVPFYDVYPDDYKCLNGVCYWFQKDHKTGKFLSFDVSDEVFEEIQGPSFLLRSLHKNTKFATYNSNIALIHTDYGINETYEQCFDVWALVEGCWSKMLTIGPILGAYRPLGFWKHGELLIGAGNIWSNFDHYNLVLYDPQRQQYKNIEVEDDYFNQILIYKESLVSVKRVGHYAENLYEVVDGIRLPEDFSDMVPVCDFFALIHNF